MRKIISVEGISKRYQISKEVSAVSQLKNYSNKIFKRLESGNSVNFSDSQHEDFWALRNVNFELVEGEVLGIVGHNGAGKSTLLKILSRITTPTEGEVVIRGRVASLLEVGTGFHPELTGRENIYFNGTILGLHKREISAKLDEIVAFSGIDGFLDTPIKRYSSGMKMRLAFSVAAHLEPEIMIIDEVLAVGDADFQNKCLGKMRDVSSSGRTIIFVSHNLSAIRQLCNRCLLMSKGKVDLDTKDVAGAVGKYLEKYEGVFSAEWLSSGEQTYEEIEFYSFRLLNSEGKLLNKPIESQEKIYVEIKCEVKQRNPGLAIGFAIYDQFKNLVYWSYQTDLINSDSIGVGVKTLLCSLPENCLNDGEYTVQLISGVIHHHSLLSRDSSDVVLKLKIKGSSLRSSMWIGTRQSLIAPVLEWKVRDGN